MTGTGRCATIAGRAGHFINNDMFQKLKALAKPIVKPCSENVDELKADMENHNERAQSFIDSLRSDAITIKFGDHSDYVHWMICHAKEQCLATLDRFGLHLSVFSCQTSEHFNKVLKRSVEKLHGFSNRGVCIDKPWKNKFGFIMYEYMLRMLHFFDTIQPGRFQTCSVCRQQGHNSRTCVQQQM